MTQDERYLRDHGWVRVRDVSPRTAFQECSDAFWVNPWTCKCCFFDEAMVQQQKHEEEYSVTDRP